MNEEPFEVGYDEGVKFCMGELSKLIKDFKDCGFNVVVRECEILYKEYERELERNI